MAAVRLACQYDLVSIQDLMSALAETSDVAVIMTDATEAPNGPKITYVNAAFEQMTGYSRDELLGRTPRMLQGPGTSLAVRKQIARAIRTKRRHQAVLLNYRKSGEAYRCAIDLYPIAAPTGAMVSFVALEHEVKSRPGRRPL